MGAGVAQTSGGTHGGQKNHVGAMQPAAQTSEILVHLRCQSIELVRSVEGRCYDRIPLLNDHVRAHYIGSCEQCCRARDGHRILSSSWSGSVPEWDGYPSSRKRHS